MVKSRFPGINKIEYATQRTELFNCTRYTGIANGYPCFVVSIAMIGLCTAFIGDIAGHLGCFIFLKDSVNAIAFVALGTSVPGKFGWDMEPPPNKFLLWSLPKTCQSR